MLDRREIRNEKFTGEFSKFEFYTSEFFQISLIIGQIP